MGQLTHGRVTETLTFLSLVEANLLHPLHPLPEEESPLGFPKERGKEVTGV